MSRPLQRVSFAVAGVMFGLAVVATFWQATTWWTRSYPTWSAAFTLWALVGVLSGIVLGNCLYRWLNRGWPTDEGEPRE